MQETREFINNLAAIIAMFIIILLTVVCCSSCTTTRTITVPEWHERTVNHHDSTATHDITYIRDSTSAEQTAEGKVITHYITRDHYHDQIRNVIIDRSKIDSVATDAAIRSAILQAQQSAYDAYKLKQAQLQLKQAQKALKDIQNAKKPNKGIMALGKWIMRAITIVGIAIGIILIIVFVLKLFVPQSNIKKITDFPSTLFKWVINSIAAITKWTWQHIKAATKWLIACTSYE